MLEIKQSVVRELFNYDEVRFVFVRVEAEDVYGYHKNHDKVVK